MNARTADLEFYRARAEQARADGAAATLDNVRERWRRSEAAWTALADRAQRSQQFKAADAIRKAETAAGMTHETNLQEDGPTSPYAAP
ncbi:MAG TPA: hypothetical protein VF027_10275 [Sphingomicrobium sp.]